MRDIIEINRIESSMKTFFLLQFKRRVYQAWRELKNKQNSHRIALVKQRAAFKENPRLARPLLVLR
jgi:hypothetical protein